MAEPTSSDSDLELSPESRGWQAGSANGAGEAAAEIGRSPRQELLRAAVTVVARDGFSATGAEELAQSAGVSPEEVELEFGDTASCILAAYDWLVEEAVAEVSAAYRAGAAQSWPLGIRQGLQTLLGLIARTPNAARMAILEVPAAGPAAHARYRAAIGRFAPMLRLGLEYTEPGVELPEEVELMAIGSVEAVIFDQVASGEAGRLPKMLPEILFSVLVPFLGPDQAAAEMHSVTESPEQNT
jgi:AcrR family transcriptional regulator